MIAARTRDAAGFAARIAARARRLAEARREHLLREKRADPLRWRMPRLLWPLFTTGE